jgi:uncharacterized membrane protein
MEGAKKRSVVKSVIWRIICIVVSILTTFLLTARWDLAVATGSVYNAITMILYYFHERLWNRITWGMKQKSFQKPSVNTLHNSSNLQTADIIESEN